MKKYHIMLGAMLLVFLAPDLFAGFADSFQGGMSKAEEDTKTMIRSVAWIGALIPFAVSALAAAWKWRDITKKEQQGHENTKMMNFLHVIAAFVVGAFLTYILYGIVDVTLANADWGSLWSKYFTGWWKDALGI